MDVGSIRRYCLSFPRTTEKLQWEDALCFKVAGKIFATLNLELSSPAQLSFKCSPERFAELLEIEGISPAAYVGRYKWVALEDLNALSQADLKDCIRESYELVLAKLPRKKKQKLSVRA